MMFIRTYSSKALVGTTIERRESYKNQGGEMKYIRTCNSKDLVGKTITKMEFYKETNKDSGSSRDYEMLLFSCSDGTHYRLGRMVCCSFCDVDASITGNIFDLLDSPILSANECHNGESLA